MTILQLSIIWNHYHEVLNVYRLTSFIREYNIYGLSTRTSPNIENNSVLSMEHIFFLFCSICIILRSDVCIPNIIKYRTTVKKIAARWYVLSGCGCALNSQQLLLHYFYYLNDFELMDRVQCIIENIGGLANMLLRLLFNHIFIFVLNILFYQDI